VQEFKNVLKNKNFFLLWVGQGFSEIGADVSRIGLVWLVMEVTGKASAVSLLFVLLILPSIISGPLAGVLVDQWNKKTVIVCSDILRGFIALGMFLYSEDIRYIYVLAFADLVVFSFFSPAVKTAIPRLVEKENLVTANSLYSITRQGAALIGPAIGGALIGILGVRVLFLVNGLSYLITALVEMWIRIPVSEHERNGAQKLKEEFREGINYIMNNSIVKFVIVFFAFIMLALGALAVLNVVLFREVFNFTAEQYGLLMSVNGAGLILGSIFLGKWGKNFLEIKSIVNGAFLAGIFYVAVALSQHFLLSLVFFGLKGFFISVIMVSYITYLHKIVDEKVRGRVFSIDIALGNVVGLLSMAVAGPLADNVYPVIVYLSGGLILILLGLITNRLKVYASLVQEYREALNP